MVRLVVRLDIFTIPRVGLNPERLFAFASDTLDARHFLAWDILAYVRLEWGVIEHFSHIRVRLLLFAPNRKVFELFKGDVIGRLTGGPRKVWITGRHLV